MILQGKILISTVSAESSGRMRKAFNSSGAVVMDFPMTSVKQVEVNDLHKKVLNNISDFHWVVFTSANGVKHFLKILENFSMNIPSISIAAVGEKTAAELVKHGLKACVTGRGTAESLANELLERHISGNCNVLLALGQMAPDDLEKKLSKTANVTRVNVYETMTNSRLIPELVDIVIQNAYDLVLFTSPSGVSGFARASGSEIARGLRSAAIGPVTAQAIRDFGMECLVISQVQTYEGLVKAVKNYFTLKN